MLHVQRRISALPIFQNLTRRRWSNEDSIAPLQNLDNQGSLEISATDNAYHYREILSIPFEENSDSLLQGIMSKVKDFYEEPTGDALTKGLFDEVTTIFMLEQWLIRGQAIHKGVLGGKRACNKHLLNIIDWICQKKGCTRTDLIMDSMNKHHAGQRERRKKKLGLIAILSVGLVAVLAWLFYRRI